MSKKPLVFAALAAAAVLVTATHAAADGPVVFSALPTGQLTAPPKASAPAAIPAREKVAGFFTALPNGSRHGRKLSYMTVVGSEAAAKKMREGGSFEDNEPVGCFSEDDNRGSRGDDDEPAEWRTQLQPMITLSTDREGRGNGVQAIHLETIVETAGRASLETVDAWVDPATRGVRLIGKASLPLQLVTTVLGGGKVFAARDRDNVQIIVTQPMNNDVMERQPLMGVLNDTTVMSSCAHIRVPLKVEKGQGEAVTIMGVVPLPSLEKPGEKDRAAKSASSEDADLDRERARIRPIRLHASVSWVSRDKEPVVSVTVGWEGRERSTAMRGMDD